MNTWFDDLSKKYLKNDYFDKEELHSLKKIGTVSIEDNIVSGGIEHDRCDYNDIEIEFDKFTEDEKTLLTELVDGSLLNTFKVINNTVPDDLLNAGIDVYPSSLDDLKITCSFNDKQINKIDVLSVLKGFNKKLQMNNFLIFKVKGLDLTRRIDYPVKSIDDIFTQSFKSNGEKRYLTDLKNINNSLLKDLKYNTKSFDFIYNDLFRILRSEIYSFDVSASELSADNVLPDNLIDIDEDYNFSKIADVTSDNLFLFLINREDDSFAFLNAVLNLTFNLIRCNAIIPQLFISENYAKIRWIPAFHDENVLNLCRTYYDYCPDNLVTFKSQEISKENQVITIISFLMDGLIRHVFEDKELKPESRSISKKVLSFFTSKPISLEKKT